MGLLGLKLLAGLGDGHLLGGDALVEVGVARQFVRGVGGQGAGLGGGEYGGSCLRDDLLGAGEGALAHANGIGELLAGVVPSSVQVGQNWGGGFGLKHLTGGIAALAVRLSYGLRLPRPSYGLHGVLAA